MTSCLNRPIDDALLDSEGGAASDGSVDAPRNDSPLPARPAEGPYSACETASTCQDLEFCVSPVNEPGFCTEACVSSRDPSGCVALDGLEARPMCLDIGIPDGRTVCSLDCSDGLQCPAGMRCEGIETARGPAEVCF